MTPSDDETLESHPRRPGAPRWGLLGIGIVAGVLAIAGVVVGLHRHGQGAHPVSTSAAPPIARRHLGVVAQGPFELRTDGSKNTVEYSFDIYNEEDTSLTIRQPSRQAMPPGMELVQAGDGTAQIVLQPHHAAKLALEITVTDCRSIPTVAWPIRMAVINTPEPGFVQILPPADGATWQQTVAQSICSGPTSS